MEDTNYTERELSEIRFALTYVDTFNHGTDGHNRLNVIAKLYRHVERLKQDIARLKAENQTSYMD